MSAVATVVQRPFLISMAEAAWRAAASNSDGPYSPIQGSYSQTFGGGLGALEKTHGVDISPIRASDENIFCQARDAKGRLWHVKRLGGCMTWAWRDLEEDELIRAIDWRIRTRITHLPSLMLRWARRVGDEIFIAADQLRPEKCLPRANRRELKRRLIELSVLQAQLLSQAAPNLAELAERMRDAGVYFEPGDDPYWLDRMSH